MQNLTFSSLSFSVSLAHCRHCQMGKAVGWGEMSMSGIKMPPKVFLSNFRGHIRIRGGDSSVHFYQNGRPMAKCKLKSRSKFGCAIG